MPIVYSKVLDVKINREKDKEENLNFDFSIESIESTSLNIRGNEEKGVKFITVFSEEYEDGPHIKIKNEVVYLVPRKASDSVDLDGDKKKIPKAIVDDVVDHIVDKTFNLAVKLGLEVGIKQPLNKPKITKDKTKKKAKKKSKEKKDKSDSKKSKKSSKKKKSKSKSKKKGKKS